MESPHERALRDIEHVFGDRLKCGGPAPPGVPDAGDTLASVSPMSAEEVKLLAEVAGRYSVPLVALGAGMASKPDPEGGSILIHFDLMRGRSAAWKARAPTSWCGCTPTAPSMPTPKRSSPGRWGAHAATAASSPCPIPRPGRSPPAGTAASAGTMARCALGLGRACTPRSDA
jgi:hypothetical protein